MTFGRPPVIPQSYIRVPPPRHIISYSRSSELSKWSSNEDSTLFWNASISLYEVTSAVIDELYESNIGSNMVIPLSKIVSTVIHIGQKLADWQTSLPLTMPLVEPNGVANAGDKYMLLKFRVVLTLRYHNLQVLLHRPIVDRCMQALEGSPQSTQEIATLQQAWHLSRSVCLRSATAIIRLVEACKLANDVQPECSMLGAWWFTLYFTFNASLTIVAIKLLEDSYVSSPFPIQGYSNGAERLDEILKSAVSSIARLDMQNHMVEQCAKFTATLIFMVQSLRPIKADAHCGAGMVPASQIHPTDGNEASQPVSMPPHPGMDDALANLTTCLPPNYNGFSGVGTYFAVSDLMDDFSTGDLFW
ncbi:hypothetical protein CCHL11_07150 [Colletotrichum chlorophyti]|uniref:Uncharacterized protein n=1 Tax=Colletotrichum chlorophyti TaxID=708187 RepID=A0A1Q8S0P7_9PEZI|nr:hypothetical protein CCHL11_07150 [Colletotrichum chlorophyti]